MLFAESSVVGVTLQTSYTACLCSFQCHVSRFQLAGRAALHLGLAKLTSAYLDELDAGMGDEDVGYVGGVEDVYMGRVVDGAARAKPPSQLTRPRSYSMFTSLHVRARSPAHDPRVSCAMLCNTMLSVVALQLRGPHCCPPLSPPNPYHHPAQDLDDRCLEDCLSSLDAAEDAGPGGMLGPHPPYPSSPLLDPSESDPVAVGPIGPPASPTWQHLHHSSKNVPIGARVPLGGVWQSGQQVPWTLPVPPGKLGSGPPGSLVGKLTPEQRAARIQRFLEKRERRCVTCPSKRVAQW